MTASWSITPGRCPSLPYPSAHSQMKCQSQPGGGGAHSLQGRCCWRHRSPRHRCGPYRVAGGHRGCGKHSGRWCSVLRGPRQPLLRGMCLLPQSRSCSPWSGRSVRKGRASTGMLCVRVNPTGVPPPQGSQQLLCMQGHPTMRRGQYHLNSPGPLGSQLASPNPSTGVWGFSVSPTQ